MNVRLILASLILFSLASCDGDVSTGETEAVARNEISFAVNGSGRCSFDATGSEPGLLNENEIKQTGVCLVIKGVTDMNPSTARSMESSLSRTFVAQGMNPGEAAAYSREITEAVDFWFEEREAN